MRRVPGEPSPAEAIAQRMRGLEAELREARQALRRNRKRSDPSARWSLEPQAAEASQDELWFITYLDMMTLMLVAMIVMLAFSGSIGKRAPAPGATIQAASPAASSPPAASVALAPSFSSTKAQGTSPHFGSGLATTAANSTAGCL